MELRIRTLLNLMLLLYTYSQHTSKTEGGHRSIIDDASGQSIRRNQLLGRFVSWKNRTLELVRMSSKSDSQLQEAVQGDNADLHEKPA